MFYTASLLLSYKRPFNLVMGIRGVGKTFKFTQICITEAISQQSLSFVWIRRTKEEIKKIKNHFFDDMINTNQFPDYNFRVVGSEMIAINKLTNYKFTIGMFIPLSLEATYTGLPFPNVKYVVYDEALTKGKYLTDEMYKLLHLTDTIFRNRQVKVYLLGNAFSISNPYFDHFGISKLTGQFTTGDSYVIENCNAKEFGENRKTTSLGQLVANTEYERFAFENTFLLDDNHNVQKITTDLTTTGVNLLLNRLTIGLWIYNGLLYFGKPHAHNKTYTIYVDNAKHNQAIWVENNNKHIKFIATEFINGRCLFETINIKNEIVLLARKVIRNY
jgi:hypothetical protein